MGSANPRGNMFDEATSNVFEKAGIKREDAPELFEEVKNILSQTMARLSATMGMSYKRGEVYEEQKQTLVDDLIKLKSENHLR